MNRTEPASPALIPAEPESIYEVEASRVTIATGDANYSLFSPLHYEQNYSYPLVVWLHGAGGAHQPGAHAHRGGHGAELRAVALCAGDDRH